jgi:hypothetical protein
MASDAFLLRRQFTSLTVNDLLILNVKDVMISYMATCPYELLNIGYPTAWELLKKPTGLSF